MQWEYRDTIELLRNRIIAQLSDWHIRGINSTLGLEMRLLIHDSLSLELLFGRNRVGNSHSCVLLLCAMF